MHIEKKYTKYTLLKHALYSLFLLASVIKNFIKVTLLCNCNYIYPVDVSNKMFYCFHTS